MKTVNIFFTNKEHRDLVRAKDGLTWHTFIIKLIKEHGRRKTNN